jgi:tRNA-modifying protein YgfZ
MTTEIAGFYCRLPNSGLLKFSGEDAGKFLQGQSTCDILALPQGQSTLGSFCNAKGRVIAVFHAMRHGNEFFLAVNSTLAERLRQHLSRYVLRAKVVIDDVSAKYTLFGVIGNIQAKDIPLLPHAALSLYAPALSLFMEENQRVDGAIQLFESERYSLAPGDEARWIKEMIAHGLPDIDAATSEEFIPQMLNLDLLNGIGFKKGCYTGQEIVARTHYLGQCKRRMFRLAASGLPPFKTGDAILRGEDNVGAVISVSVTDEQAKQALLAVINIADINSLPSGLRQDALPYTVIEK